MRRNPIYVFDDRTSMGIDQVPLGSVVQVLDADGIGNPAIIQLVKTIGVNSTTTIGDFLDSDSSASLDQDTLSELEKVDSGWRLLGKNPANYATVGINAVDLSTSEIAGTFGAKGVSSFAVGTGTIASNTNSVAMGTYNVGTNPDTILEIGGGINGTPSNVLEIYDTGIIVEPTSEIVDIDNRGPKALTTVEYVQTNIAAEFPSQTTDTLTEGISNIYYTDARDTANFDTNMALQGINILKDVDVSSTAPVTGQTLKWNGVAWVPENDLHEVTSVNSEVGDVVLNTDKVSEGTNKYYSELLFDNSLSFKTTDNVPEGTTNLYYNQTTTTTDATAVVTATPLSNLNDVSTTAPLENQVLTRVGSEWIPKTPDSVVVVVDDLTTGGAAAALSATQGVALETTKAALAGAAFTGLTEGVPPTTGDSFTTKLYVDDADALKANLAGPTFTGVVTTANISTDDIAAGGNVTVTGTLDVTGGTSVTYLNVTGALDGPTAVSGIAGLMPGAAVDELALLTAAPAIVDSAAADVPALVADFNALLASLRTAGIIS